MCVSGFTYPNAPFVTDLLSGPRREFARSANPFSHRGAWACSTHNDASTVV